MQALKTGFDADRFFEQVAAAQCRVLMLDYDGTLAPFRVDPAQALPYPGVVEAIDDIAAARHTRVAVVSGRAAREVRPLLATRHVPEIWGAHGWERLSCDDRLSVHEPGADARRALVSARETAQRFLSAGARVEEKRASVALHWRGLPAADAARIALEARDAWLPLVRDADLELLPFDSGLELRARGWNKAAAVNAILSDVPVGAAVAYLGDDITDEDAFRAVKGRGVAVLVRPALRETGADLWLRPPAELLSFLRRWGV